MTLMSKKHFIALADHLKYYLNGNPDFTAKQRGLIIDIMATFCQSQNSQFKRSRWEGYIAGECGPNGGSVKAA